MLKLLRLLDGGHVGSVLRSGRWSRESRELIASLLDILAVAMMDQEIMYRFLSSVLSIIPATPQRKPSPAVTPHHTYRPRSPGPPCSPEQKDTPGPTALLNCRSHSTRCKMSNCRSVTTLGCFLLLSGLSRQWHLGWLWHWHGKDVLPGGMAGSCVGGHAHRLSCLLETILNESICPSVGFLRTILGF